jgi:hypothetical protein
MSLLFAWVYISDYFEVVPILAMAVQVLVSSLSMFSLCRFDDRSVCRVLLECTYGQRWEHLHYSSQMNLRKV